MALGSSLVDIRAFCHNLMRVKRACDTDYDTPYAFISNKNNRNNNISNNNINNNGHSWNSSGRTTCVLRLIIGGLSGVLCLGVLVIAGHVANDVAGPAIVSSLVIAAVSSLLSGLCYAEFQTRQTEISDSVYTCFYQNVGELSAFVIGWCLVLQHSIGVAVGGRALSALIDYLTNHRLRDFWLKTIGSESNGSAPFPLEVHPDFVAGFLVIVSSFLFQIGRRCGQWLRVTLVTTTVFVAVGFVAIGAKYANNSTGTMMETSETVPKDFLPNESSGLLSGAAICTFSFSAHYSMDFKMKANRRPERNIPLSIGVTLTTCFVLYFAVATIFTLLTNRRKLDSDVPLVQVFELRGVPWAFYITAIGHGVCFTLTLLSISFTLYSSVISLANDGLLFRCIVTSKPCGQSAINKPGNSTTLLPSILFGSISAFLSTTYPLTSLLHIIALPPLIINTMICNCVLYQRYQPDDIISCQYEPLKLITNSSSATSPSIQSSSTTTPSISPEKISGNGGETVSVKFHINKQAVFPLVKQTSLTHETTNTDSDDDDNEHNKSPVPLLDLLPESEPLRGTIDTYDQDSSDTDIDAIVAEYKEKIRVACTLTGSVGGSRNNSFEADRHQSHYFPTEVTGRRVLISVVVLFIGLLILSVGLIFFGIDGLRRGSPIAVLSLCLLIIVVLTFLVIIVRQPQNRTWTRSSRVFRVPFLPWIPAIAIFINLCLFASTMHKQWAPFMVWMIIGGGIYCVYGMWNSTAARQSSLRKHRAEKIQLRPMPTQPFDLSTSVLPMHKRTSGANCRITQVDTIFISR